jgi:hypothetical protein
MQLHLLSALSASLLLSFDALLEGIDDVAT